MFKIFFLKMFRFYTTTSLVDPFLAGLALDVFQIRVERFTTDAAYRPFTYWWENLLPQVIITCSLEVDVI